MAQLRAQELRGEAARCSDLDRLQAINAELEVILGNLRDLRRDQIVEEMRRLQRRSRRRWFAGAVRRRFGFR